LELDLRDDVRWNDGENFDADDVVDTLSWIVDPKSIVTNKGNWSWIERVEKTGPHTVRVIAHRPTPFALPRLSEATEIYPEHVHGKLQDRLQFGRRPVGTGMYRATQVDSNKGVILVKNPDYKHISAAKPVSNVGQFHFLPVPDSGTQIAHLLADGVEMIKSPEVNQIKDMVKDPRFAAHVDQRITYAYLALDAIGRAGQKALTDVRVRKALLLALDRKLLTEQAVGDAPIPPVPAMCWKLIQAGCDYSVELPPYNPAEAKRLLAEAGHGNGLEIQITCYTGNRFFRLTEVVVEQFRQIGVRATSTCVPPVTFRKIERENKIQAVIAGFPAGTMPDVAGIMTIFFTPDVLDFHGDAELHRLAAESLGEMDPARRTALGRQMFDALTERAYVVPIAPLPGMFVHTKDVRLTGGTMHTFGLDIGQINWAK
jgi:peptide/nickel transport system substrate-binding protein